MAPLAMRLAVLALAFVAAAGEQLSAEHEALPPISFEVDEKNFNSDFELATEGGNLNYRFSDTTGVVTDYSAPAPSPTDGEVAASPPPARYYATPPSRRHGSGVVQPPSPPAPSTADEPSTDLVPGPNEPDQVALAPGPEVDGLHAGAATDGVVSAGVVAMALLAVICLGHL